MFTFVSVSSLLRPVFEVVFFKPERNQGLNVKSNRISLLEFEFTGDTSYSNPDWNNFKISSYISWDFIFSNLNCLLWQKK